MLYWNSAVGHSRFALSSTFSFKKAVVNDQSNCFVFFVIISVLFFYFLQDFIICFILGQGTHKFSTNTTFQRYLFLPFPFQQSPGFKLLVATFQTKLVIKCLFTENDIALDISRLFFLLKASLAEQVKRRYFCYTFPKMNWCFSKYLNSFIWVNFFPSS